MSLEATSTAPRERGRRAVPRATRWVLAAAVPLLVAYYTMQLRALPAGALRDDLGIHYYLARLTARGAVPLVDFEHGWNTGSWYLGALLYRLAGGDATVWTFLWGRVTGFVLAGLVLLVVAWRLRLEARWAAVLVLAWMLVTHVPNGKYALPLLWLAAVLPVGAVVARPGPPGPPGAPASSRSPPLRAAAVRALLVAAVWWLHVELALLLGAGTALYDLFGARGVAPRDRLLRVGAVAAGLALGASTQVAVYAALGLGPLALLSQLLLGQAETAAASYGYPLGAPATFRTLVYPATLVLPFVPALWRRLSSPTRLVAFLHLSQALIAIRRTDDNHIAAAATLLAVLVVLAARDVLRSGRPALLAWPWPARAGAVALGAAWAALAVAAAFRVESRLAVVALVLACLAAVAAARGGDRPWASAGAAAALAALVLGGLGGHVVAQVRASDADGRARAIAAAVRDDVDACLGGDRRAWVVPDPLTLYDHLDLANPTPFYLFWYTFEGERERVEAMLAGGEVPVIVQVGPWPPSMTAMVPAVEEALRPCARVPVPATGEEVTVWTR